MAKGAMPFYPDPSGGHRFTRSIVCVFATSAGACSYKCQLPWLASMDRIGDLCTIGVRRD